MYIHRVSTVSRDGVAKQQGRRHIVGPFAQVFRTCHWPTFVGTYFRAQYLHGVHRRSSLWSHINSIRIRVATRQFDASF